MTRPQALAAIRLAGIEGDQTALVRIYTENRVSYVVALRAYADGVRARLAANS